MAKVNYIICLNNAICDIRDNEANAFERAQELARNTGKDVTLAQVVGYVRIATNVERVTQ